MTPVRLAEEALHAGDVDRALKSLQDGVRAQPADAKLRVFLFQLLCVLGQWDRAATQLEVCGQLDPGTLTMVGTYRVALQCERLREAVFAGRTTPMVFGRPQPWVAWLIEALQADARGDAASAQRLRAAAYESAPASSGRIDGVVFDWIADADSRLGPVLEAVINGNYSWVPYTALGRLTMEPPSDLRDLVWVGAQVEFSNGGEVVGLIPSRYPGTAAHGDAGLRLARRTEWLALASDHFSGLGQRVLATSAGDVDWLGVRVIELDAVPPLGPGPASTPSDLAA